MVRLKKIFSIAGLVFFILPAGVFAAEGDAPAAEFRQELEKVMEEEVWDFGTVKEGAVLKHKFTLSNQAEMPLTLQDMTTSCSCTVSELNRKALAPGESAEMEVVFDTKGYHGPVEQFVFVTTDNPEKPILRFKVTANILKK